MKPKSKAQEKFLHANKPKNDAKDISKLKGESHEYDHHRPKKPVQSRYK